MEDGVVVMDSSEVGDLFVGDFVVVEELFFEDVL